uniref:Stress-response A/B barrel domain-containing protein n=1 Tax=Palpitomonas bilix TaxID=652834 RepID=A0A7S3GMA4_9EUKA
MEHIVLFSFKSNTTAEQIDQCEREVLALREVVPCIIDISFGRNFTDRGKQYTHALVARLASAESLEEYQTHPSHQRVLKDYIRPIVEDVLAIDFSAPRLAGLTRVKCDKGGRQIKLRNLFLLGAVVLMYHYFIEKK